MTRFGWLVLSGIVLAIAGIALLLWGFARQSSPELTDDARRTQAVDPSTLSIYSSGAYGFSFLYPASARVEDSFAGESWRTHATATGTPVVRVVMDRGETRIGVSGDARAVASCLSAGPSEEVREPLAIGTTTWSVFAFDELGTENERRVTSYRTVHEERCVALETFEPVVPVSGTLPTDDAAFIIRNFTFAR